MSFPHPSDAEVADIVRGVGRSVLGEGLKSDIQIKRDGSYVTEHDLEIQARLFKSLTERWPGIPLLSEEMSDSERSEVISREERFWCLDPLDGTTNFTSGLPFYGISLALVEEGISRMGIVYDPSRDECFTASAGTGALLNGMPLRTRQTTRSLHCIACVDFKRLARTLSEHLVARPPYKSQRNLGACVLEWCWLAANRFQLYLHGGQKLWDYAAGNLILREAGGSAVTLDGCPIPDKDQYKSRKISVVAASNPALLDDWLSWIHDRADLYNLLLKAESAKSSR
jgi:myo-inositol-1(or 4)-monophosphatase